MRFSDSLPTILPLLVGYFLKPAVGGTYDTKLNAVDNHMAQLDYKISELQSVAQTNGHYDVHLLCEDAKDSLQKAQSAWKNIASSYGDKPWLASDSTYKEIVVEHWYSCGSKLESVYEHPNVLPENGGHPSYSKPVQDCRETYDTCQSGFKHIWNWQAPKPVASGSYYKRQNKARRDAALADSSQCPAGETACPISAHSTGLECIDVQSELTSCGGCVSKHEGENCMDITGAAGVGCHLGRCVVLSVHPHYFLGQDGRPILKRRRVS
ncbi:hypothetical protein MJO29_009526 [Puccinia striiformis f. sp. tritici]|uniref:hypothetical protein n=1 Tax=Puccinia striiformis f. sp. tritici TaxID=168172 RepID=UPI002008A762|nr:hypothetical protein Pst134EA_017393 [Puccinia striiformis f. sp. tritici]KAH9461084.1 hypothetical protein Pst134EA_017393 [Puccinia striiformis f. sp. tritici]KAI7950852.1 hypothetical protein MJO29_009526 [Puccinia striiformis f. sp. tritici]KAI9607409.1 hypothetical protein H4Q26_005929 [Puccinia striiformis f. sp. tritici PST-130]